MHLMTNTKNAEKAAEEKYDVVYHFKFWLVRIADNGHLSLDPNLDLHTAAVTGNVGLVHYALTHGQPVNSILHGLLPIHAACSGGSEQVLRMLIDRGADVNAPRLPRRYFDPRQQTMLLGQTGSTPLHFAAANGHDKIVRILLACGAIQRPDKSGNTPEMVAEQSGHKDVVETFRTWEAMLEEEREKVREREEESKKGLSRNGMEHSSSSRSQAIVDEDDDGDHVSPTLEKQAAWKGKGRAESFADRQQKLRIRKSIDHMFGGRRGGSLRIAPSKTDKTDVPESRRSMDETPSSSSASLAAQRLGIDDDRKSSLPGFLGRAAHPFHRKSHTSETDLQHIRGRSRVPQPEDGQNSGPSSIRQMSKHTLLQLFRRGHNGSPPSSSPSPPRTTIPILPTDDLDESVERIKRLSMDGIRPAPYSRPRSGSQVSFQNPLVSRPPSIGGSSASHGQPRSVSAPYSKTEFGEGTPSDSAAETESFTTARDRRGSQSSQTASSESGTALKPLSRIDTQLSKSTSNGDANSDEKKEPKSILKTRAETLSSPSSPRGFARLSPWHEPSTPSPLGGPKPRSATMPTSYFQSPLSPQKNKTNESSTTLGSKGFSASANEESPDFDRREKEDGIGESIWDRAAARNSAKGRSRGASFTSMTGSSVSGWAAPSTISLSLLQEPEGTDWTFATQRPPIRLPSLRRYGRSRNNTVSTMTSMASNGAFSIETMESNLTPPSLSSSHFASGSSGRPRSEDGISIRERVIRRVGKRRADGPEFLYTVPIKGHVEEQKEQEEIEKAKREAVERRKRTEQEILKAMAHPDADDSSLTLAEQLAAYGDIMAMQDSLSRDSHDRPPSSTSSSAEVSRSYARRPSLKKTDSTDSNATIKTENSRRPKSQVRKASSVPVSASHSRNGSDLGNKTAHTGHKMDTEARQEALRLMPGLDTLFTTHAPSAAIPSINRIYETRAAAYRDKGLALKRQAPLYGSSAKNPNRPPVRIEDHWLMAGIGRKNSDVPGQTRPQRAVSLSTHPVMEEREINRPAISAPMMISHTDAPTISPRKLGRSTDGPAPATSFQGKPMLKTATTASKIDTTASVVSPAMVNARPVIDPTSEGAAVLSNGSRLGKTLTNFGASAFGVGTGTARRRASGPLFDEKTNSPDDHSPLGKGTVDEPWFSGATTRKTDVAVPNPSVPTTTSEARQTSGGGGGEVEQVPPAVAGLHKHRWGDGLKSAMRLGKSRS
ncbi:hypothetical protein QFC21_001935 [Naganishia friedmannii]|uniref:Uncharacterized protein n=1 Tax=Naganishia friedmannii TaxID=89922 RepID=A0ACC2VY83_9TREE|nr:hypothetical protein QFC21_001935 [Naganishia friedmannii]